jgi:hypothetical protein
VRCNSLSAAKLLVKAYEVCAAASGGTINCVIAGRMLSHGVPIG